MATGLRRWSPTAKSTTNVMSDGDSMRTQPQRALMPRSPAAAREAPVGGGHEEEGDEGDDRQGHPGDDQPVVENGFIHEGTYTILA